MTTIRVGAEQLRRELADLLARVGYAGDRVIVERHGTPQAVVIPYALYEEMFKRTDDKNSQPLSEDEIEQMLIAQGILLPRDRAALPLVDRAERHLIETTGKPLSEVILDERR